MSAPPRTDAPDAAPARTPLRRVIALPDGSLQDTGPSTGPIALQVVEAVEAATARTGRPAPQPRHRLRRYRRWAVVADALVALVAGTVAVAWRFGPTTVPVRYLLVPLVLPFAWVAIVAGQRAYEARFAGVGHEEPRRILQAGLVLFTSIAVVSYAVDADVSRSVVLLGVPATVAGSLLARRTLRAVLHRRRLAGRGLHRVLVVGRADATAALVERLDAHPEHGLTVVGACVAGADEDTPVRAVGPDPVALEQEILAATLAADADVVAVVSHPDLHGQALRRLSWALDERRVELVVSPGIVEVAGPRLSIRPVAGLSLLHLEAPRASGGTLLLKSVFDRVLGSLLLAALAPLLVAVAVAIRLTSPGPALFRQVRVGADGREFRIVKFRTMVADAEQRKVDLIDLTDGNGVLFKMRTDPRVTTVGGHLRRFSLDELPQLINVVRGDMSLVGPRPPLPDEVAGYDDDAARRLRVRPGMTGLWQISGRSDLSWEESLLLDLRYVDNWSLGLDITVLWRTLRAVTRGTGAY